MTKKRKNDGRQLEGIVAFFEKLRLPENFSVEINKQVIGDSGLVEAELDILISGLIGSANFRWLIECRDRPSSGAAPSSWIEQLIGRRDRMKLNKITAASTQPFSKPALALAKSRGIDLRHVKSFSISEFQSWLNINSYNFTNRIAQLDDLRVILSNSIEPDVAMAAENFLNESKADEPVLTKISDLSKVYPKEVFLHLVEAKGLFDKIIPNADPVSVKFGARYLNPTDCFCIDTEQGLARIEALIFTGQLSIKNSDVPIGGAFQYSDAEIDAGLSEAVIFENQLNGDKQFGLALHRDLQTDEIMLVIAPSEAPKAPK